MERRQLHTTATRRVWLRYLCQQELVTAGSQLSGKLHVQSITHTDEVRDCGALRFLDEGGALQVSQCVPNLYMGARNNGEE